MRKLAAMFILLAYIAFCIFFFASLGSWITNWPRLAQLFFYLVAGFIWIAPLKYLFVWLNKGAIDPNDP